MKFTNFLKEAEERNLNSGAIIKDVLDYTGVGLEPVRQTQTKENNKTSIYKEKGFTVNAIWVEEDGPMKSEGYSSEDAERTLLKLLEGFKNSGGNLVKTGNISNKTISTINFDNFSIDIIPFAINSALDGSGFNRTYLKIVTK